MEEKDLSLKKLEEKFGGNRLFYNKKKVWQESQVEEILESFKIDQNHNDFHNITI